MKTLKIVILALMLFSLGNVTLAQNTCTHLPHNPGNLPEVKVKLPNYGSLKTNPQPWDVEVIHQGTAPDPKEILIMLDQATISDLSDLRETAYQCAQRFLETDGIIGYENWYTFKVLYSTQTYTFAQDPSPTMKTQADGYVPDWDLLTVIKNENVYGGAATLTYAWTSLVDAPEVFRHELAHLLATLTSPVKPPVADSLEIWIAVDEWVATLASGGPKPIGRYNLDSIGSDDLAPFIDAGYEAQYGYGPWGNGYIIEESYMYSLSRGPGVVITNYNISVGHYAMDEIIHSHTPELMTVQSVGLSQKLSVDAADCNTCSYQWTVDGQLVQTGKRDTLEHIFAQYPDSVNVMVEIIDTNELIVDTRYLRTWSREWTVIPDTTVEPQTEIFSFEATRVGADIEVNWETNIEFRNDKFVLFVNGVFLDEFSSLGNTINLNQYSTKFPWECNTVYNIELLQIDAIDTTSRNAQISSPNCTGIEVNENSGISLFPNPATNHLIIESPSDYEGRIYDIAGHEIKSINLSTGSNTIDISGLSEGVYLIYLSNSSKNEIAVKRFVK